MIVCAPAITAVIVALASSAGAGGSELSAALGRERPRARSGDPETASTIEEHSSPTRSHGRPREKNGERTHRRRRLPSLGAVRYVEEHTDGAGNSVVTIFVDIWMATASVAKADDGPRNRDLPNRLKVEVPDELVEAVARRVAELAAALIGPAPWLDVAGAAEHLCCPHSRLYALVSAKRIPHDRDGSRLLFDRAELDAWVRHGGARRP